MSAVHRNNTPADGCHPLVGVCGLDWRVGPLDQGGSHCRATRVQVAFALEGAFPCLVRKWSHTVAADHGSALVLLFFWCSPHVAGAQELPKEAKLVVAFRDVGQCVASMYKFWNPMVRIWFARSEGCHAACGEGSCVT